MTKFKSALLATIALAATAALARPATAIEYPWCAQYSRDDGRNCGFVNYAQCMETVRGIGGYCEPNLFYTGRAERPTKPARKRAND
jgi:Protein of unknown function (DUF3551)